MSSQKIYGDAQATLEYLERCQPINQAWRVYMAARGAEVQAWINDLRRFANLKPGPVSERVTEKANGLQSRLDRVLRA